MVGSLQNGAVDVACGECGQPCGLVDGRTVYPTRPDLAEKVIWRCAECGAYVGVHEGTTQPLGAPAGPETRRARERAHGAFDPLWARKMHRDGVSKSEARGAAYQWLAAQLGVAPTDCHIGMMDAATATRAAEICLPFTKTKGSVHDAR